MSQELLVVHVQVHVKADALDAFRSAVIANAAASRKEPGVVRFDVVQDLEDPTRFVLVEVYRGEAPASGALEKPLDSFQIGLPGTWILPDNRGYEQPLCPPGTYARDNWPPRGPSYRDVFQTIEGGSGFWTSTQFGSAEKAKSVPTWMPAAPASSAARRPSGEPGLPATQKGSPSAFISARLASSRGP